MLQTVAFLTSGLDHPATGKLSLSTKQKKLGIFVSRVKQKETKTFLKSEIDILAYIISLKDKKLVLDVAERMCMEDHWGHQ